VSTLMSATAENESDGWAPVQDWMLSLRRRGKTVILVHHAGKSGTPRGTSRREDILDVVVALRRPNDYREEQGCRFEWTFTKARGISGRAAETFEAQLDVIDSRAEWTIKDVASAHYEAAVELLAEGVRPQDVAAELGISRSQAFRYQKQARAEGRLER